MQIIDSVSWALSTLSNVLLYISTSLEIISLINLNTESFLIIITSYNSSDSFNYVSQLPILNLLFSNYVSQFFINQSSADYNY